MCIAIDATKYTNNSSGLRPLKTGFVSLCRAMRDLRLAALPTQQLRVDYQSSSIGTLSQRFTSKLFGAMRDNYKSLETHTEDELCMVYPSRAMALLAPNQTRAVDFHRTKPVNESQHYRILSAGLKDLELGSPLSHAKIMRVRVIEMGVEAMSRKATCGDWLYVGSHNLSPAAWERSYECGVVFRYDEDNAKSGESVKAALTLDGPRYPVDLMWDN